MSDLPDNTPLPSNDQMVQLAVETNVIIAGCRDAFTANSEAVDEVRWNKLYPYQLVVVKSQQGCYTPTGMKFTLPMTPQELSIQTPFAIANTITADGVAEEHNGVKVKNISLSGSLGSAPLRGSNEIYNIDPGNFKNFIAGGTIKAWGNLKESVQDLASSTTPRVSDNYIEEFAPFAPPTTLAKYKSTGYYQHLLLDSFLQGYAAMKLRPENKDYRLAFCIWKDDAVYLVTPIAYTLKRSASSPGEYMYDLQLKAWKRISLFVGVAPNQAKQGATPQSNAARALKKLHQARNVIYKAKQTVEAVRGDADRLMGVVREAVLAARDAAGVSKTVLDMPASIKGDYEALIEKQVYALKEDIKANGKAAEDWGKL